MPINEKDSTVSVSLSDIRTANLIFVEHSKLLKENALQNIQIHNYQISNQILKDLDSIRCRQIQDLTNLNLDYSDRLTNLDMQIAKEKQKLKYWQIGGVTVSVCILLLFLLK